MDTSIKTWLISGCNYVEDLGCLGHRLSASALFRVPDQIPVASSPVTCMSLANDQTWN